MSGNVAMDAGDHRDNLLPVVLTIFGVYVAILTTGYFVGNLIYQIP